MRLSRFLGRQTAMQASIVLVGTSVLSRVLGLVREMLVARSLGSSAEYDLFLTVFMIPSAITTAITYTVAKAVTPYFQQMKVEEGQTRANLFAWKIVLYGSIGFALLGLLGAAFAGPIVRLLLPGSSPAMLSLGQRMFCVLNLFPLLFFIFSAVVAFLRAERLFFMSAIASLLLNLVLIPVIGFSPRAGVWALLWGWCLGLIIQAGWVVTSYLFSGHVCPWRQLLAAHFPRRFWMGILVVSLQITFIELWGQLWTVCDRFLAQQFALPAGSISNITYASTLYAIPLSMFSLGIGNVIFPFLAEHAATGNRQASHRIQERGMRAVALLLIPVTVFLLFFSPQTVGAIYQRGAFDAAATHSTAVALRWLGCALPLDGLYVILSVYLYASRRYGVLITTAIMPFLVKLLVCYALLPVLGYQSLPLSTFAASLSRLLLLIALVTPMGADRALAKAFATLIGASVAAALPAFLLLRFAVSSAPASQGDHLLHFFVALASFGGLFVLSAWKLGIPEVQQALHWAKGRLPGQHPGVA